MPLHCAGGGVAGSLMVAATASVVRHPHAENDKGEDCKLDLPAGHDGHRKAGTSAKITCEAPWESFGPKRGVSGDFLLLLASLPGSPIFKDLAAGHSRLFQWTWVRQEQCSRDCLRLAAV